MKKLLSVTISALCLVVMLPQAQAKTVKAPKPQQAPKERLVLMPLRVGEDIQNMLGAMETALAQGLQQKYEVFSGMEVEKKTREIFRKESAKKNCDETRCMEDIAIAFQSELIAVANVTKIDGGYLLALSIRNVFDNKSVHNNSVPCKGCDVFQVVEKLKELSGAPALAVAQTSVTAPPSIPRLMISSNQPVMVRIPEKRYEIGKYEVTQGEWRALMGRNPSWFSNCGDNCPVEFVTWNDVQLYIAKLNAKSGKLYRLPTGAEWEFACYGGGQSNYCGGGSLYVWNEGIRHSQTHVVDQNQPNGYGLYGMTGNVWEWMEECNEERDCRWRVLRGGSGVYVENRELSISRVNADQMGSFIGFRLARTLP